MTICIDSFQNYQDKFLNKPADLEYYVDASVEVELKANFLKSFFNHNLLKFIGINKKYNHDYVKAFYCNLLKTSSGIENRFKDKIIRFNFMDFNKYLGLTSNNLSVFAARLPGHDIVQFVLSISKFICDNLAISNFNISQV
ncbi:hypothetical protein RYX36_015127 [Vicia faba]